MRILIFILSSLLLSTHVGAEWKLDLSRRAKKVRKQDFQEKSTQESLDLKQDVKVLGVLAPAKSGDAMEEVVILNTTKGFVPSVVRIYQGKKYRVHLVNVNNEYKNISFMMDSFSQHHSTYFGQVKTFEFSPEKDGVYYFLSPETAQKGQLIVHPATTVIRSAASVEP